MLGQRFLVALLLLPIGIAAIMAGGAYFLALVLIVLILAAIEFLQLFQSGGFQSARTLLLLAILGLILSRYYFAFQYDYWIFPLFTMIAMIFHLVQYEKGRDQAASDFAITMSAFFYVGLLGAFMLSIRQLDNGEWWLLLTFTAVWVADSAAFFVGSRFGKNKMAPRLSPKKSWQGYFSGVIFAWLAAPLFLSLFHRLGLPSDPAFTMRNAAILAVTMAIFPTLGDFGISMIKRQMSIKDSGSILPGHGGMLDRIDSWLWAFPISYFLITQFFLNQ